MHKLLALFLIAVTNALGAAQTVGWNVDAVHAAQVWPLTRGANVNVVVIDGGIDFNHADLQMAYAGGFNALDPTQPPYDAGRHGTHLAGIIAADDNDIGVTGIAPAVHLWAAKVFDEQGAGSWDAITAALDWVTQQKQARGGNWIVNMSFSDSSMPASAIDAVRNAAAAGVLLVASAGFPNPDMGYPAVLPEVISVGAVDSSGQRYVRSATGPRLALMAPGVDVLSTITTNSVPASFLYIDGELPIRLGFIAGSHQMTVKARVLDCGSGRAGEFPAAVRDGIAVMQRSELTFTQQAENAMEAGAIGVIIANTDDSSVAAWSLEKRTGWPLAGAILHADTPTLLKHLGETVTLTMRTEDYARLDGTSQAAPHVAAIAALLWSLKPAATAQEIRDAMTSTAHDLGSPGWDEEYGYGLVDAAAAARKLITAPPRKRRGM